MFYIYTQTVQVYKCCFNITLCICMCASIRLACIMVYKIKESWLTKFSHLSIHLYVLAIILTIIIHNSHLLLLKVRVYLDSCIKSLSSLERHKEGFTLLYHHIISDRYTSTALRDTSWKHQVPRHTIMITNEVCKYMYIITMCIYNSTDLADNFTTSLLRTCSITCY